MLVIALAATLAVPSRAGAMLPPEAAPAHAGAVKRGCTGHLHGTMRAGSLTISQCKAYIVTKSLTINAKGSVTIAKPLELAPGAGLTIKAAGPVVIKAPIGPQPRSKTAARTAQATTSCSAPRVWVSALLGVDVDAHITGTPGGTDSAGDGCPGGSVTISADLGPIHIRAPVHGGDGGPGKAGKTVPGTNGGCHAPSTNGRQVWGGYGGLGGSVVLHGHSGVYGGAVTGAGLVYAGNGGDGAGVLVTGADGGDQQAGMGVLAFPGPGGDGGDALLYYNGDRHPFGHGGAGGAPGYAVAHPGNGGPPDCDGGFAQIAVAKGGDRGAGSLDPTKATPWSSVRVSGGNGADASPPPSPLPGGAGGYVNLTGGTPVAGAKSDVHAFVQSLAIIDAGDGGKGSNGCPASPGGSGGRGGELSADDEHANPGHLLILSANSPDRTVTRSFNGGHGGDGVPPGRGGFAGADSADGSLISDRSFMPGDPGSGCPVGATRTATGSLTDNGGGLLAYSLQTNQPANAFRLTLPTGDDITGTSFPSGFNCTDNANQEICRGGSVIPGSALSGIFAYTGTIAADCGCVQLEFSADGGQTWSPFPPSFLTGPSTGSGGGTGGTGGTGQPLAASILNPTGTSTFLDGPLGGATTSGVTLQTQISGGTPAYTATIDWGDGTSTNGSSGTHSYPAPTSLDDGKMVYPLAFDVSDSAGHMVSARTTITVLCSGISGAGFTADLGSGPLPTIVFCGHWDNGFVPAKVVYMRPGDASWQFIDSFNIFENLVTCPNPTTTEIGGCQPKDQSANPTLHFGVAANVNVPVASGMKIAVEGEDSGGHVVQTFTGTVQ